MRNFLFFIFLNLFSFQLSAQDIVLQFFGLNSRGDIMALNDRQIQIIDESIFFEKDFKIKTTNCQEICFLKIGMNDFTGPKGFELIQRIRNLHSEKIVVVVGNLDNLHRRPSQEIHASSVYENTSPAATSILQRENLKQKDPRLNLNPNALNSAERTPGREDSKQSSAPGKIQGNIDHGPDGERILFDEENCGPDSIGLCTNLDRTPANSDPTEPEEGEEDLLAEVFKRNGLENFQRTTGCNPALGECPVKAVACSTRSSQARSSSASGTTGLPSHVPSGFANALGCGFLKYKGMGSSRTPTSAGNGTALEKWQSAYDRNDCANNMSDNRCQAIQKNIDEAKKAVEEQEKKDAQLKAMSAREDHQPQTAVQQQEKAPCRKALADGSFAPCK